LGPLSGQRLPALAGALTLAAVLVWVLWRRWCRHRSDRGGRTPSPEAR
jgi:hypothetical protein